MAATRSSYSLRCFLACPWGSRSGIQVYAAETQAPYSTRVEIHSNFTVSGSQTIEDAMLPTNHAESRKAGTHARHQRVGRGWLLSLLEHSSPMADGSGWVTTFARGCMPLRRHWPVGVSLSTEFGYQRAAFSPDTWTWEIRPIVDRKIGPWYLAFNPALDRWFHGPGVNQGVTFSPTQRSATTSRRRLPADWNTTWNTTRPMVRYPTSPLSEISSSNSSPRSTSISLQNGSLTLESE